MKEQILKQIGRRAEQLRERFGAAVLDDEVALAEIAAKRRAMTPAQKPIFAAIHLLRRAGIRASKSDIAAWAAAGGQGAEGAAAPAANAGDRTKTKAPKR